MEIVKQEQGFAELCKGIACRIALWGVLLIGAAILIVGLPLAVLKS